MKTPRELILQRHQSAETKLNAIRGDDLAACARSMATPPSHQPEPLFNLRFLAMKFWQESIRPWRRIWAGMAAIWLVLLALNLATHETPKLARHKTAPPDPELLAALREQQRLMRQWFEPAEPPPASPPKIPGPRSERRQTIVLA
jgi:hypothetical protein